MKISQKVLLQILFVCFLVAIPLRIVKEHYSADDKFLGLIYFGDEFEEDSLPEVKEIDPARSSPHGYDGQFYAQIALRPTLSDPALIEAVDNIGYRAQRIGLPWLAYLLGAGQPNWVLQIYALLNFVFYFLLLGVLWKQIGFHNYRDCLLAFSLLLTTGTLVCLSRALTDFPATSIGVMAMLVTSRWWLAAMLLSGAAMIKDSSILSFAAIPLQRDSIKGDLKRLIPAGVIVCLPITLWALSLSLRLPAKNMSDSGIFGFPLLGIGTKILKEFQSLPAFDFDLPLEPQIAIWAELICPMTLLVQAAYMICKPKLNSQFWRFGIGFAILLFFLGESVWEEHNAYTRVCLPLTFAFNLLIHKFEKGKLHFVWFISGNLGMFSLLFLILGQVF
ncbi:hypothetical protein OAF98_00450 [Planctomicrobium sp.]|jgi:hypothetical protein|nr:hypothetical protein [Planctomicrobium sp.]MDB4731720.1 hypothetical protein [bacterium]MDB4742927.1 hypothetical protein [Planctomicrobium sp.]MDB4802773.1 hypothetical protein [bacterium]